MPCTSLTKELMAYPEVTGQILAMKMEQFRRRVPLPPDQVESYIDTLGHGFEHIINPEIVVQHVWEYTRAVVDSSCKRLYFADQR